MQSLTQVIGTLSASSENIITEECGDPQNQLNRDCQWAYEYGICKVIRWWNRFTRAGDVAKVTASSVLRRCGDTINRNDDTIAWLFEQIGEAGSLWGLNEDMPSIHLFVFRKLGNTYTE